MNPKICVHQVGSTLKTFNIFSTNFVHVKLATKITYMKFVTVLKNSVTECDIKFVHIKLATSQTSYHFRVREFSLGFSPVVCALTS